LKADLLPVLESLQPTGFGNRRAHFVTRNLKVLNARAVGRDSAHLKLAVSDGWITFDGIAFRQGQWVDSLPARIDLLHAFERNEFNGRTSLQLNILDIKPAQ
jgi:single-stranded-DNA-specific exonuclease